MAASNKQIKIALNNAVALTSTQHGMETLTKGQWAGLRQYAGAFLAPLQQHIDEDLLTPQMATFILSVAACFISQKYLGNKMPADDYVQVLFGQTSYVEKPADMLCVECGAKQKDKKVGRPAKNA